MAPSPTAANLSSVAPSPNVTNQHLHETMQALVDLMNPKGSPSKSDRHFKSPKVAVSSNDCLDNSEKTKVNTTYSVRTVSPTKKGFSFGVAYAEKRFISPDLAKHQYLGSQSPGPMYSTNSFTDQPHKAQSFPRSERMKDEKNNCSPGPKYDASGTLGRQSIRPSAPIARIGTSERFNDKAYLSQQHSQGLPNRESPAPTAYNEEILSQITGGFSFTSGRSVPTSKIFVSREHAEHDSVGIASPGPCYNWDPNIIHKRSPAIKIGTGEGHTKKERRPASVPPRSSSPQSEDGSKSPKESVKSADKSGTNDKDKPDEPKSLMGGPAYSFGVLENANANRFISRAHSQACGTASPGPCYLPNADVSRKSAPAFSFADRNTLVAQLAKKWPDKLFISSELAKTDHVGKESPGPASYDTPDPPKGYAFTMAKREKVLMKRICPAPERARFISKELAKENMGAYSPGPKYKIPSTIGGASSIKWSIGGRDRSMEELEGKEADKIRSKSSYDKYQPGAESPGPKYEPKFSSVEKRSPAHTIVGRWKGDKLEIPTKEEYEEERKKSKKELKLIESKYSQQPCFTFNKGKRGLLKEDGEAKGAKQVIGRDSPGPVYKPNFYVVDNRTPALSFGALK